MAFDEKLAARVREVLSARGDVEERKMFGGLCFLVGGHMCCGLTNTFMVRVGKERLADALAQPHARPMDFTGRPSTGMVYVDAAGIRTRAALLKWVQRGLDFVATLASKKGSPKRPRRRS
jgi:TfoX/Sxy family transcriptional regulator of competence genes